MPEKVRLELRQKCLSNLFSFAVAVMGYDDIAEELHGKFCNFLSQPSRRKQVTMPRSFVKTWLSSIAYPIWITLNRTQENEYPYYKAWEEKFWQLGPNMRVLIASYVISNANKMINLVRQTYERNTAMQILFPDVIPEHFKKVKWSDDSACIRRSDNFTESTFEAAGIGGASTSRHYDLIIEDDLIYAKKDDFSDQELQPGQDDIDKAIGWHKLATSLLVPGKHTHIHNTGTRWAKKDLVDYIWRNESSYEVFKFSCVVEEEGKNWKECKPAWPEVYDQEALKMIYDAQGPYMFSTQYLLKPIAPEEMLFKGDWLQKYTSKDELPDIMRIFTTVDLAGWTESKRKGRQSRGVILTCGWDTNNNVWVLHYDVGRFDPSTVIDLLYKHWNLFAPEMMGIETVYYQKALVHFLRKAMEKRGWMRIRELETSTAISKELRIRGLEPYAANLAIHCKPEHKDFIEEFCEYVPNSPVCTKDIMDALAYQIQVAKPGVSLTPEVQEGLAPVVGSADEFFKWAWRDKSTSVFKDQVAAEKEDMAIGASESRLMGFMDLEDLGDWN